uniref:Uncharacterized protein n=1 Tax=Candidatus Kentrum sp. SD TaxID=2126332 RepID=A0A450YGW3_9GAMM|nr:MAG: hypothetical protein BECKSD772F_GA0070984_10678 [Candidatus Kentron sp. SD]VFK44243.1 MAG: hypothetical protein BECKSD772E_GA0070983_103519 [Candidatus Kentron sp. SD]VFK79292.1 MAG: hypothetical protein BECKSD772D_GA0070982_104322 [Candidatus Kentron sp. SD]
MEYGQLQDLKNWAGGWRFPDLWLQILNGEEPDPETLQTLLRGYAEPVLPSELWGELLEKGEFDAGASLLDNREFLAKWPEKDRDELERELERYQSEHQNKIEVDSGYE